jgi:hypothetical protein
MTIDMCRDLNNPYHLEEEKIPIRHFFYNLFNVTPSHEYKTGVSVFTKKNESTYSELRIRIRIDLALLGLDTDPYCGSGIRIQEQGK